MRLLLIEDDAALRLTLARQLEADGYRVDQAKDGEEGLFLAREYVTRVVAAVPEIRNYLEALAENRDVDNQLALGEQDIGEDERILI